MCYTELMSQTNLNFYKTFLAVYEAGSISQAGDRLCIASTTVGYQVRELESQLNTKLFVPHPRGVTPTDAAVELYDAVKPALALIKNSEACVQEFNKDSEGIIRIACTTNNSTYYLADHIIAFNREYPKVQFEVLKIAATSEINNMLKRSEFDLIISALPLDEDAELNNVTLGKQTSSFIANKAFANANNITPNSILTAEHFDRLPFIAIKGHGEYKKPVVTVESHEAAYLLVKKDFGVGWCIDQFLEINHPDEPIIKFGVEGLSLREYKLNCVFYKKALRKATLTFINMLKSAKPLETTVTYTSRSKSVKNLSTSA